MVGKLALRVGDVGGFSSTRFPLNGKEALRAPPAKNEEKKTDTHHKNSWTTSTRGYAPAYALDGGLWARGRV